MTDDVDELLHQWGANAREAAAALPSLAVPSGQFAARRRNVVWVPAAVLLAAAVGLIVGLSTSGGTRVERAVAPPPVTVTAIRTMPVTVTHTVRANTQTAHRTDVTSRTNVNDVTQTNNVDVTNTKLVTNTANVTNTNSITDVRNVTVTAVPTALAEPKTTFGHDVALASVAAAASLALLVLVLCFARSRSRRAHR